MNTHPFARHKGFTLIELMAVVLIIGTLAAIAIPSYLKTMEIHKAESAANMVRMIGTANKMFKLDQTPNNQYATGSLNDSCLTSAACDHSKTDACQLIYCNYLANESLEGTGYDFVVGQAPSGCSGSGTITAGAKRCTNTSANKACTSNTKYGSWAYVIDNTGKITGCGTDIPEVK
ncbi:MAG: type II secretion system protein [Elusimicrobiota bacterium]